MRSIRNAALGLENFSGVGSTLLNLVNLKNFDLVNGGQINLTGGVHQLYLNSVGANTQIHLRELPGQFTTGSSGSSSATDNGVNLQFVDDVAGARTLTSVAGRRMIVNFSALSTVPQTAATIGVNPGPPPAPAGIVLSIGSVQGRPRASSSLRRPRGLRLRPGGQHPDPVRRHDRGRAPDDPAVRRMGTMTTGVALGRDNTSSSP